MRARGTQSRRHLDTRDSTGDNASLGPAPADIRAQLERIVASVAFRLSPRRAALLRFVVEETLQGRADRIKAVSYTHLTLPTKA